MTALIILCSAKVHLALALTVLAEDAAAAVCMGVDKRSCWARPTCTFVHAAL